MSDTGPDPAAADTPAGVTPQYRSKGQLAMAAVARLIEPIRQGDQTKAAKAAGVSVQRLNHALLVRRHAQYLVQDVIAGRVVLDQAYALAQENRRREEGSDPSEPSDRPGPPDRSAASDLPGTSDHLETTPAVPPPLVLRTKRNSGRTGPKRLTAAEVAQRDQHAHADHLRRYGQPLPMSETPMPPPPGWFSQEQRTVWEQTLAAAPPGLLRAGDADNLAVLCSAIDVHRRLARQLAESAEVPDAALIRQLRQIGTEIGRASKLLGLTPPERIRIGIPAQSEQEPAGALGGLRGFPKVVAGGKAA